jgi:hypothetical protein
LSDAGHGSKAASASKSIAFPVFEMQWKIFSAKRPNRLGGCYNRKNPSQAHLELFSSVIHYLQQSRSYIPTLQEFSV